jgi:hypothetical protein
MSKPLVDLTLRIGGKAPNQCDFSTMPRFTKQERDDARVLMRAVPLHNTVYRECIKWVKVTAAGQADITISGEMFRSIAVGRSVPLVEIAEGKEANNGD